MPQPTLEIKSKAVRAGAGAGKTYNLTHRVAHHALEFYQSHKRWPRTMVTTFTRKATQELSERLVQLALKEDPALLEYVSSGSFLQVSTIHGILDRFLKDKGHVIGLKSDFSHMNTGESHFLSKKILKNLAVQPEFSQLFAIFSFLDVHELLRSTQEQDLENTQPLNRELAERLLAKELKWIKEHLEDIGRSMAGEDLGPKFADMQDAVVTMASLADSRAWETNYELFLEQMDRINFRIGGKEEKAKPFYGELKTLMDDLRDKRDRNIYDPRPLKLLVECNIIFEKLQKRFCEDFQKEKMRINRIDLSDLENFTLQIVRKFQSQVTEFARDTDYWLIDEFQDTSPRQIEILASLVGGKPYYFVGDPQQSIYLFRGARAEIFDEEVEKLKAAGGELEVLDTNYRSTQSMLHLINAFSKNLGPDFKPMKPSPKAEEGEPVAAVFNIIAEEADEEQELHNLYEQLMKYRQKNIPYEEMAVLCRKNDQLEKVSAYLSARGVPVHSAGFFWRRREVKDAAALLKFLLNPRDDLNLVALLRSPYIAVSEADLAGCLASREGDVWTAVKDILREGHWGRGGQVLAAAWRNKETIGLVASLQRALEELGIFDLHLHFDASGRAEGNIWKFLHLLKTFEKERGANFIKFLQECERAAEMEKEKDAPGSVEPDKVNLLTVHGSKGLQFEVVLLPFLGQEPRPAAKLSFAFDEKNKIWSIRTPHSETETGTKRSLFEHKVLEERNRRADEEALRGFYVAYTRAKKFMYISWQEPIKNNSWAALLTAFSLEPGVHDLPGCRYEVSREAAAAVPTQAMTARMPSVPAAPHANSRWSYFKNTAVAGESVTDLVQTGERVFIKDAFIHKQRGILFHKLMEILRHPTGVDFQTLIETWFPEDTEGTSQALNYVMSLEKPPMVRLLKEGQVEWPFRTMMSNKTALDGQIDLWGVIDGELWVVDYKSGESVRAEQAWSQLSIYAKALSDYLKWTGPVRLSIVYPFLQKTLTENWQS